MSAPLRQDRLDHWLARRSSGSGGSSTTRNTGYLVIGSPLRPAVGLPAPRPPRVAQLQAVDSVKPVATEGANGTEPPPLVCVHGLSASSRWWVRVAKLMEASGPVVLVDVPRSLKPSAVAGWLAGRIEEAGRPVDLAGHSLGALVSVQVAAFRPELVRRLVLISPPGIRPRRSPLAYAWPLAQTVLRTKPAFLARLTYDGLRAGPRNLARGGLHVASADVTAELVAVAAPTLLVWGARDRVVPVDEAPAWLEWLRDARLVVLPGAGHVPMVESPDELAEAMGMFRQEGFDETGDSEPV
jgi:pimeloyl-ACP methyl ester carboxylesterase